MPVAIGSHSKERRHQPRCKATETGHRKPRKERRMRITTRITTTVAKVVACLTGIALVAATAACSIGGGAQPSETPSSSSPTQPDSPISIVAAENTWGSVATRIAGDMATVTSIVTDATTDMSTFAPNSDQKTQIANAQIVIMTGAGYDSWASDMTSQGQSVINAAATIGAGTGDNAYLWMSSDARKAVAKAIVDALTKLEPDASDAFGANLDAWQDEEDKAEIAISDLRKYHDDLTYAATTPVAYYLMSEVDATDATPDEWTAAATKGTTPDATAIAKFTLALKDGTDLLITDSQRSNSAIASVLQTAQQRNVPTVSLTEIMPNSQESLPNWIEDIVSSMDEALTQTSTSASASASSSASAAASNDASGNASASASASAADSSSDSPSPSSN